MTKENLTNDHTKKKIRLTKKEIKEILIQYKIMRHLLETTPKRKILTNPENEWHLKKDQFLKKHPKIDKLFKKN
jgi:hypothetical protein